jgi:hypothetical protein
MQYREYMRKIYDIFIKNSFYLKKNEIEKNPCNLHGFFRQPFKLSLF